MLLKVGTQDSNAVKITLTKFHQHLSCGSQVLRVDTTAYYTIKAML